MVDSIGWIGTVVMAVAALLVAHKRISGLWLMLLGNLLFALVGLLSGLSSLIGVSVFMACLDYYGIYQWRKDASRDS